MRYVSLLLMGVMLIASVAAEACSFFSYAGDDLVLFGNSEDHFQLPVYAWYVPATSEEYACLFVGFDTGFAQGGVNSAGLAFDAAAISEAHLKSHPELPYPDPMNFCEVVLRQCATVDEAIALMKTYNLDYLERAQFLFTDRTGKTVVVAPGRDWELEFLTTDAAYRVVTNTNVAYFPTSHKDCPRHQAATAVLEEIDTGAAGLSIDTFERALDAVAIQRGSSETVYSNVFDLTHGQVYLYFRHDFDVPAILSMAELAEAGEAVVYEITDLVSSAP